MYHYMNGRPHLIREGGITQLGQTEHMSSRLTYSIGTNSTLKTTLALMSSILTSTGLSMPYLMCHCGIFCGTLLAFFSMFIAVETATYICAACDYTKQYTYSGVVRTLLGKFMSHFSLLLTLLLNTSFSVSYFSSVFNYLPMIIYKLFHIDISFILENKIYRYIVIYIILFPWLLYDNQENIGYTKLFSIFFCIISVIFTIRNGIKNQNTYSFDIHYFPQLDVSYPRLLVLVFMWFNAHVSLPSIYKGLKMTTNEIFKMKIIKMKFIIYVSYIICWFIYILIGIFGYMTYGNNVALVFLSTPTTFFNHYNTLVYFIYIFYCYFSLINLSYNSTRLFNSFFYISRNKRNNINFINFLYCFLLCYIYNILPSLNMLTILNCSIPGLFLEVIIPSFLYISMNYHRKTIYQFSNFLCLPQRYHIIFLFFFSIILIFYSFVISFHVLRE